MGNVGVGAVWDLGRWQLWLRAAGGSEGTIRLRTHFVRALARDHPDPGVVTADDVMAYLGRPGWAPETRKAARASLRSYYRWATISGRVDQDPTLVVPAVHIPIGVPKPTPEHVLAGALKRADHEGRLILLLAAYAGLRRAEIAGLPRTAFDFERTLIRVQGKGGRVRLVPIHPALLAELVCCAAHQGDDGPWVFPSPSRPGQHVGPDYIANRVTVLLGPGWTTHSLRHRFATQAYRGSRDLRAVQTLLGHSKPETTARYVAVTEDSLAAAVLAVP